MPPVVKLSADYKLVDQFEPLVSNGVPSLLHCRSLTIEGKMEFDPGVSIIGDVKFIALGDQTKRIRPGTYRDQEIVL